MTLSDLHNRQVPDYYPTMYRDGYSMTQILMANRRRMLNQYNESQAINQIKIISEVRVK